MEELLFSLLLTVYQSEKHEFPRIEFTPQIKPFFISILLARNTYRDEMG